MKIFWKIQFEDLLYKLYNIIDNYTFFYNNKIL